MRLNIFPKLLLFAAAILGCMSVIFIVGGVQINDLFQQQRVKDLEIRVLRLYQIHTKFQSSHRKDSSLVQAMNSELQLIEKTLEGIDAFQDKTQLLFAIKEFREAIDSLVVLAEQKGLSENKGSEGLMREAVHEFQEIVAKLRYYDIQVTLLEARRREKDFFMRADSKYAKQTIDSANKALEKMLLTSAPEPIKQRASVLTEEYKKNFLTVVEAKTKTAMLSDSLSIAYSRVQHTMERISSQHQQQVEQLQMINIVVALASFCFVVVLSVFMGRRISKPIEQLQKSVQEFSDGSYQKVSIKTSDEIQDLANAFNTMVDKIAKRTEELADSYTLLQIKSEEINSQKVELEFKKRELESTNEELLQKNMEVLDAIDSVHKMQTQLIHSERMNAIGMLTSGILHEINNPNTAINLSIENAITAITENEKIFQEAKKSLTTDVQDIERMEKYFTSSLRSLSIAQIGLNRITTIISSLRTFSKKKEVEYQLEEASVFFENSLILFRVQFPSIHVEKILLNPTNIYGSIGELNQVVLNMCVNAVQAGATSIELIADSTKKSSIIKVKDNGKGIPKESIPKLFDSFFSTKGKDNSGLGLSISKEIISRHKGTINVESEIGNGTTFIIELPMKEVRQNKQNSALNHV
ncbi:MAG: HAMP domain-containing protein [Candidatus Kapabacteria bacterium]|nr:HAMP domain-containing protein [Candidatus Kapabacteria bacterium]